MIGLKVLFASGSKEETFGSSDLENFFAKNCFKTFARKVLAIPTMLFAFTAALSVECCQAQSSANSPSRLVTKSIKSRFDTATNSQNRFDITAGLSIDDVMSTPLQSNTTVNDTFIRTERQQGSLTLVYNTFNPYYIDNVVSARAIDALDLDDAISKQIAAYEGTLLISRTLASSPMANVFARFSEDLRAVRDALMFRVSHGANGELGFEPKKKYGKTPTFLELRLTPNTRDGIAPRLRFGENVTLSHDFTESATFLEYNLNF